ncbi:hypothetical protein GUJ93_ZPchr0001g32496 [Zizania palustris]|uniref:Uncharacterized protein n=1 Tax=Zizania palustris TaxID=103762 RepID=A0A8J5VQ37_ZIZPA|nr:hypothetical protein GUJ93_ZPchr0001g32496 [Zizania palustris]
MFLASCPNTSLQNGKAERALQTINDSFRSLKWEEDCIGSAFNAKGVMQCPNCRKIEKGNWLYANGSRPSQDVIIDEWANDEDYYDASQLEASRSVFLPFAFNGVLLAALAQLPSVFDEGETAAPVTFHDFMGPKLFL